MRILAAGASLRPSYASRDQRVPHDRPRPAGQEANTWPMTLLEVVLVRLLGSSYFLMLNFFKGYWKFLIVTACEEYSR
ncbi:hypothetical protein PsorP6_001321 [Peronosclerospora sorghi]|uniref:Uncharacterized protein n=1 Tax=Peronosclerospora sorghi TaxID=230839 RepID=A0ACC0WX59_9STRA|nr:hypothetical protein PsorP6_001321 [Peronosclerospora sorghi]